MLTWGVPPSPWPDLVDLDLLDSVAELGSLGQVAARHGMSQPAVSMRMSQLERKLGIRVLDRDSSGTRLTVAGERVVVLARRVLLQTRTLLAEVDAMQAAEGSRLRVAASLTIAEHLLPGWLAELHQRTPDVSVLMEMANSATVLARVRGLGADVGFVEGHTARPAGMDSVIVRGDHLLVLVDPEHPWARRGFPVTGAELAATELIVREEGSGTREILQDALAPWGMFRWRMELSSTAAILAAVRRGEGPAVVSALAAAADLDAGRLVAVGTEGIDLSRSLRAVWRAGRPLPPLAEKLIAIASHKSSLWIHKENRSSPGPEPPLLSVT
jgi:DNA-binding transcriptional LysR family regulator